MGTESLGVFHTADRLGALSWYGLVALFLYVLEGKGYEENRYYYGQRQRSAYHPEGRGRAEIF